MRLGIGFAEKPSDWIDTPGLGCVFHFNLCSCLSICVSPRLWPIIHIFALFIFSPLFFLHSNGHTHTPTHMQTYVHAHTRTLIYTAYILRQRWPCLLINKYLYLFLHKQGQKWFQYSTEVCFPPERRKRGFSWSFLCRDVYESLSFCSTRLWLLTVQKSKACYCTLQMTGLRSKIW